MLLRLETHSSPQDKVITLLLRPSVFHLYRARILRSVVSRAQLPRSLPKAEIPLGRVKARRRSSIKVRSSAAAALGFVPKWIPDLEITLQTFKYHVTDIEEERVSHDVCQEFPMGYVEK